MYPAGCQPVEFDPCPVGSIFDGSCWYFFSACSFPASIAPNDYGLIGIPQYLTYHHRRRVSPGNCRNRGGGVWIYNWWSVFLITPSLRKMTQVSLELNEEAQSCSPQLRSEILGNQLRYSWMGRPSSTVQAEITDGNAVITGELWC